MHELSPFIRAMDSFARQQGRHELPWRQTHTTPYGVWVSEVMLQQTQVQRVIPYYLAFMERFPDIFCLSCASWEEFLPLYRGLGYYRRGENMLACASQVVKFYEGEFPREKKALMALPGIGEYTASAILSFGYGLPHLAFDTNMQKVFGRYLHGNRKAKVDKVSVENIISREEVDMARFNGAVMDFAATLCQRTPHCHICPVKTHCCYARHSGTTEPAAVTRLPRTAFDYRRARVYLWLHQRHRCYYSAYSDSFAPFVLAVGVTSRQQIKEYFRTAFELEVAVRPPHARGQVQDHPALLVHAQILQGEANFCQFPPDEIYRHPRGFIPEG
ncbi:A/G-specific adenine glycosylase [Desulfurispira natronophila]|uniref:Adenine DNA glycosylase n=1 Tax=Desulfurispira natronophila TaxID=682562 RepID=A0A7W7Y5B0_9BACT|nr:A/G-specific adenine glycosylase [Desulfurispira natronophila]MBB5022358.1 A/G-specific adenine glycosylase [Desulfurispira natronophila]